MGIYTYEELETYYEHELDSLYEEVNVCGNTYESGALLRAIDPKEFEQRLLEWIDERGYRSVTVRGDEIVYDCGGE